MPRNYRAAGSFKANGWEKMISGKRLRIHCGDLGLPEERWNQDDSYQAAAAHWEKIAAEMGERLPRLMNQAADVAGKMGVLAGQMAIIDEQAKILDQAAEIVRQRPEFAEKLGKVFGGVSTVLGTCISSPPGELTVGKQFDTWKGLQLAAKKSPARKKMNIQMLEFFVRFTSEAAPLETIDENCWERYFLHLTKLTYTKGRSEEQREYDEGYKGRVQAQARSFIEWLSGKRLIHLPMNLNDPHLRFEEGLKAIKEIPLKDVRTFYAGATGQTRLHIRLMLNCAFNGIDISELMQSEIDWKKGTITRNRSKLRKLKKSKAEKAPVVTYKLWDDTFALLKEYNSKTDPVLQTVSGQPWIKSDIDEESYTNSNSIASNFRWLRQKTKAKITTKNCRTAAATALGKGPFKHLTEYFLGETPSSTTTRFYMPEDDAEFFRALAWLEKEIALPK